MQLIYSVLSTKFRPSATHAHVRKRVSHRCACPNDGGRVLCATTHPMASCRMVFFPHRLFNTVPNALWQAVGTPLWHETGYEVPNTLYSLLRRRGQDRWKTVGQRGVMVCTLQTRPRCVVDLWQISERMELGRRGVDPATDVFAKHKVPSRGAVCGPPGHVRRDENPPSHLLFEIAFARNRSGISYRHACWTAQLYETGPGAPTALAKLGILASGGTHQTCLGTEPTDIRTLKRTEGRGCGDEPGVSVHCPQQALHASADRHHFGGDM
jgi:hypothetical protein